MMVLYLGSRFSWEKCASFSDFTSPEYSVNLHIGRDLANQSMVGCGKCTGCLKEFVVKLLSNTCSRDCKQVVYRTHDSTLWQVLS